MKIDPDAPFYPRRFDGPSIRAELAARAMQGLIAQRQEVWKDDGDGNLSLVQEFAYDVGQVEVCAEHALLYADALIAELNKDVSP